MTSKCELSDFKVGDRVKYVGEAYSLQGTEGTVARFYDPYVRVKWDGRNYTGIIKDSGAFPYNLELISPPTPEQSFAASLREMATAVRERAKAQNRIAEKAEALAREMDPNEVVKIPSD